MANQTEPYARLGPHPIPSVLQSTEHVRIARHADSGAEVKPTYHLSMPTPVGSVLAPRSSLHDAINRDFFEGKSDSPDINIA
jgi:hypothetical protein